MKWLILWNSVVFITFAWDKYQAIHRKVRVPEKTLLAMLVCLGSIGGLLAMYLFRHKIKKGYFVITGILGCVVLAWLYPYIMS